MIEMPIAQTQKDPIIALATMDMKAMASTALVIISLTKFSKTAQFFQTF